MDAVALPKTKAFQNHEYLFNLIENIIITTSIPIITFMVVIVATVITIVKLRLARARREMTTSTLTISAISSAQVRYVAVPQPARVR